MEAEAAYPAAVVGHIFFGGGETNKKFKPRKSKFCVSKKYTTVGKYIVCVCILYARIRARILVLVYIHIYI